jgi:hypothetical protein
MDGRFFKRVVAALDWYLVARHSLLRISAELAELEWSTRHLRGPLYTNPWAEWG